MPIIPTSRAASSPARITSLWTCFWALSTTSSIRPGWTLPSFRSISRATLATSRRTGSNELRIIIPGVSSTIMSTPVALCRAWIFRPSLPIIRPFISSSSSLTALTTRSAVTSLAIRSIVCINIAPAFSSAKSLVSFWILVIRPLRSFLMSRSVIAINFSAASFLVSLAIFSSLSCCLVRMSRISFFKSSISLSAFLMLSALLSKLSSFLSRLSSRPSKRFSISLNSLRRVWSSFLDSSASSVASFFAFSTSFSASSFAFLSSFFAFSSALPIWLFDLTVLAP